MIEQATQTLPPVTSYGTYLKSLREGMADKDWFLPRLQPEYPAVADFGCADGALLDHLRQTHTAPMCGYDADPDMRHRARLDAMAGRMDFTVADNPAQLYGWIKAQQKESRKVVLNLSAVLHEMLSEPGQTFPSVWNYVRAFGADFIAIRDFAVSSAVDGGGAGAVWVEASLKARHPVSEREDAETYLHMSSESWLNHLTVGSGYTLRHWETYNRCHGVAPHHTHFKALLAKQ